MKRSRPPELIFADGIYPRLGADGEGSVWANALAVGSHFVTFETAETLSSPSLHGGRGSLYPL